MSYLGIDVGESAVKLAVVKNGSVRKLSVCRLEPEESESGAVPGGSFSRRLRDFLRAEHITARKCALSLPRDRALVHSIRVPRMKARQLRMNLPFEFRDYIRQDRDLYFYDYAVIRPAAGGDGEADQMELLAAASPKKEIAMWRSALQKAGLQLTAAVPEPLSYRGLIAAREAPRAAGRPKECCVVDLGARSVCMHMYRDGRYETSHVFERGGLAVEELRWGLREGQEEQLQNLYDAIAAEILRAVNFYGFHTPGSDLRDLYFCGGLAQEEGLMRTVRSTVPLAIHSVAELMPPNLDRALAERCSAAAGAAMGISGLGKEAGYPAKTGVNLACRESRWKGVPAAVPVVAASLAAAALVGKFGVADLLEPARQAQAQVEQQQSLSAQLQKETADYDSVLENYRRELATQPGYDGRPDVMECLSLVESELLGKAQVSSFTISSDTITVKLSAVSLERISEIYEGLTASDLVSGVQVYTANTESSSGREVTASMTIHLAVPQSTSSDLGKKALS